MSSARVRDILAPVSDDRIGSELDGRYRIQDKLGAGAMGVVYRGERIGLGRNVAIKFLHEHMATDDGFLTRFAVEAQATGRLQHPNCAAVIDFGVVEREPYVVMDLVAGQPLRDLLDDERLSAGRALGIMRQILAGLAHAHEQGITHRDIKPDNIMVESGVAFGDQVCILDFGLAKVRESATGLTVGMVVGTPNYMAPEQTLAQPVDERTDVYAAGIVLFEMLTGEKPFRADTTPEILRMQRETPPPRLASFAGEGVFSDELEYVVARALAKAPAQRFHSATAFAQALDEVPEMAARAATPTPLPVALEPTAPRQTPIPGQSHVSVSAPTALVDAAASDASRLHPRQPTSNQAAHAPGNRGAIPGKRWMLIGGGGLLALIVLALAITSASDAPATDDGTASLVDPSEIEIEAPSGTEQLEEKLEEKLAEARALTATERTTEARALLEKLRGEHREVAEVHYLLGQVYFETLWVKDGLAAFEDAIELNPAYSRDPAFIDSVVYGLANDRYHKAVAHFLTRRVGAAARPAVAEMAENYHRREVRTRASRLLRRLPK
ncbi:serine/threonine protein kinase with TPR repeats [Haliangium ochraceum DSM 14365]|uniref:Serine/threonine protein kinase with TPR repeats n=1 Tax=Haliangium ochraceum (strain DSM 14365 / JCM 11303 / SMP-2) TaxID=502025 RepID=D0LYV8_HALO1|nr:serine/threonine protein kinase with TPR repeats [Haliangium ochraceum DSM 14365]